MAKWTRISLSLLTLLTAAFIILGALMPTFVNQHSDDQATVGLFKTCHSRPLQNAKTNDSHLDRALGLTCYDNDKVDKGIAKPAAAVRHAANSAKQNVKSVFGKEDTIPDHTYQPRPTAEKVSAGFLCTAGVLTALIGFFSMFPSMTVYAYTYMISPIVLHVIGMALAIWTGIERYKSYPVVFSTDRKIGAGLGLQIASLLMLIVLAGLWTMPGARKTVVNKYTA